MNPSQTYVVDTDILTLLQRGGTEAAERAIARVEAVESSVFVTIVSFEEQTRGWLGYISHARTSNKEVDGYARLYELIEDFSLRQVLLFTSDAAQRYQSLRRTHRRAGALDLKIAAIAIESNATLVTRNAQDFRGITGLLIEDWTK